MKWPRPSWVLIVTSTCMFIGTRLGNNQDICFLVTIRCTHLRLEKWDLHQSKWQYRCYCSWVSRRALYHCTVWSHRSYSFSQAQVSLIVFLYLLTLGERHRLLHLSTVIAHVIIVPSLFCISPDHIITKYRWTRYNQIIFPNCLKDTP